MTNEEDSNIEEEFEYNDGLGDLLREKERKEFSWVKTVVVLVSVLGVIALSVVLVVRIGKRLIVTPSSTASAKTEVVVPVKAPSKPNSREMVQKAIASKTNPVSSKISKPEPNKEQAVVFLEKEPEFNDSVSPYALYRVVVGSFMQRKPAELMARELQQQEIDCYVWTYRGTDKTIYRVQVGAFKKSDAARTLEASIKQKGLDPYIVRK